MNAKPARCSGSPGSLPVRGSCALAGGVWPGGTGARLATAATSIDADEVLLLGSESTESDETVAVLLTVRAAVPATTLTWIVTLTVAPVAIVAAVHCTALVVLVQLSPVPGKAPTTWKAAGMRSLTTTFVAVSGPLLVTSSTQLNSPPGPAVVCDTDLTIERSELRTTDVVSSSVAVTTVPGAPVVTCVRSAAAGGTGGSTVAVPVAWLNTVPPRKFGSSVTLIVIAAVLEPGWRSRAKVQMTGSAGAQLHWPPPSTETRDSSTGRSSMTVRPPRN